MAGTPRDICNRRAWARRYRVAAWVALPTLLIGVTLGDPPAWLHITLTGRTVHNSHYLAASFLYQLQTMLGAESNSPSVTNGGIIRRQGKELYINLDRIPPEHAATLRQIASPGLSPGDISLTAMNTWMDQRYYQLTHPYPTLQALLNENPYRDNPNWMAIPVDSATFHRRRVLHINKDRITDALVAYFSNNDFLLFEKDTLIVAESFDKPGNFVEAEVLRKRGDTFWNFSVYDSRGALVPASVAFDENGEADPAAPGLHASRDCAFCHRVDRLDLSGDPEAPVRSPIRGFFQRLPARTPEIHLGPEYYDHMAFTELTEANAKRKDGVFGVYGSLLLSELAGRKRLGTLTAEDRARYQRLQPYYPELLTPLERIDSVTNSIGMRLIRIPVPKSYELVGSPASDPEHRSDETRHHPRFHQEFFLSVYKVTNREYRCFRPDHHVPPYRGVTLDGDDQPAVSVTYADALAFVAWLNALPAERAAGRNYRLPTEDEWEFAARGGDDRRFPWGDQWPPPQDAGNFADEANGKYFAWEHLAGYRDGFIGSSPIGKFLPNPYFLYDMGGNAYEWTASLYEPWPGGSPAAPLPVRPYGIGMRVARGSSWADELPKVLRCAFRNPTPPETSLPFLGLRMAADIPSLH
jgi:formylglycine-generating enzyme required for sulfatase activity